MIHVQYFYHYGLIATVIKEEYQVCKYETGISLIENTRLLHENDKKYFIRSIAHR